MGKDATGPDITGHWISIAAEPTGESWVTREFRIEGDRWQVLFHCFADAAMTLPLFTLDVGGIYAIGGPSGTVVGAYNAIFPASRRHVTVDSDAGAGLFASMGATIAVGERRPVTDATFAFIPALMDAMGEYDLVALRNGQLFFGDRNGDLTKVRPTALTPFALARVGAERKTSES